MKHSAFKRFVSGVIIVTLVAASTEGLGAQQATPQPTSIGVGSAAEGQRDGELLAETMNTGGKVASGVAVGALTGMLGTGIVFLFIGPQDLSADAAVAQQGKSAEYQLGFKTGWAKKTKDKKRKSFLLGGLLGSPAFVLIALYAISER